jgi:hypothetical protein
MIQRFAGQLPTWARPGHPVLRYELGKIQRPPARVRYVRALMVVLLGLLLVAGGYIAATSFLTQPAGQSLTESLNAIVFWPLLIVQIIAGFAALALTANAVSDEMRRQNWDNLRATTAGAELAMRARWASVFYRIRGLLAVILLIRLVLIGGILYDLTAFQGRYLDLLINGLTPEIPLAVAVLLLSLFMTATLLLPITAVGFDAAVGLLLSTLVRQRTYNMLLQLLLLLLRIGVVIGLVVTVTRYTEGQLPLTSDPNDWLSAWGLMGAYGAFGDWGLAFLNLSFYGEIWATVRYGVLLGLGLLIFAMVQAVITDQILALAVRRAEKSG